MTKSRLAILIDTLASGGEVFSSHAGETGHRNGRLPMNRMGIVPY